MTGTIRTITDHEKRNFLKGAGLLASSIILLGSPSFMVNKLIRKLKYLLNPPSEMPPEGQRAVTHLPAAGKDISVELALNSRCTSDYDDDPKNFHWGMFNKRERLSDEQIHMITRLANIPRFTRREVKILAKKNILTFAVDNNSSGIEREWVMVESGMLQQAMCLICAALGVGIVFRNRGKDGRTITEDLYGTISMKVDALKPSYDGSFWTPEIPGGRKRWRKGNLPAPKRNGSVPLLTVLRNAKPYGHGGRQPDLKDVSQILWAARGRTPHYYKSRPWGMTIPTWAGEQNISRMYYIEGKTLYKYVNWKRGKPTHALEKIGVLDISDMRDFSLSLGIKGQARRLIVLQKNDPHARALWEVGYQLLNIILQSVALRINYESRILTMHQRLAFQELGIRDAIALVLL